MLGILIVKELRASALSYRFALALVLLFGLIVGSVLLLAFSYERQLLRFSDGRQAQDERLETLPYSHVVGGIQVARRPSPLSVLALGLEPQMAREVTVSIHHEEPDPGRGQRANRLYRLFPTPDLVFIVSVVVSLLAVLFAFDAVAGEGEAGTLQLVLANAVPRHQVLLAKWLGGYLALVVPFMLAVVTGLLLARLTTGLHFSGPEWIAAAGMVAVALLYIAVYFGLGMMVSAWAHRAATSLVVSFLVWVLLVLVVPNVAPILARALAPAPTAGALSAQRMLLQREKVRDLRRLQAQEAEDAQLHEVLARYRHQDEKLVADFRRRVNAQLVLGVTLSRLSPSASYVHASVGLAGNGWRDYVGLQSYLKHFKRRFLDAMAEVRETRTKPLEAADVFFDMNSSDIDGPVGSHSLPVFAPERPGVTEALGDGRTDLLLLALLNGLFFLGAYSGFLRYDLTA